MPRAFGYCIADFRYRRLNRARQAALGDCKSSGKGLTSDLLDRFFILHRFGGVLIFLAVMYGLFWCALAFGGMFQEPMSVLTSNYLVALPQAWLTRLGAHFY